MSKILIDEAVVRQALEDLEFFKELSLSVREIERAEESITALNRAIANEALDQMADNAKELGLSYEQPAPSDMKQAIIEEASIQMTGHPSKDARWFAKSVYEYLMAEQPAKDEFKAAYIEAMVASNEAGFSGMSAAETIRELSRMVAEQPAQPARKPLTEEQIDQVIEERGLNYYFGDVARNRVVLRELRKRAAHGITSGGATEKGNT